MELAVSFGEDGRVRVLDAEQYAKTKELQEQTAAFSSSESVLVFLSYWTWWSAGGSGRRGGYKPPPHPPTCRQARCPSLRVLSCRHFEPE